MCVCVCVCARVCMCVCVCARVCVLDNAFMYSLLGLHKKLFMICLFSDIVSHTARLFSKQC